MSSYDRLGELGEGQFGVVYRARLRSEVFAVKELRENHVDTSFIISECEKYRKLKHHENIVYYKHFLFSNPGPLAIIMEYCDGVTYSQYIRDNNSLNMRQILHLFEQIANGLAAIHCLRIIHRNLSTKNVFVRTLRGGVVNCKVSDYGIVSTKDGVQSYMDYFAAPETLNGSYTYRSDLFSFGAIVMATFSRTFIPFLAPVIQIGQTKLSISASYASCEEARVIANVRGQLRTSPEPIRTLASTLLSRKGRNRPKTEELVLEIRCLNLAMVYFERFVSSLERSLTQGALPKSVESNVINTISKESTVSDALSGYHSGDQSNPSMMSWGSHFSDMNEYVNVCQSHQADADTSGVSTGHSF